MLRESHKLSIPLRTKPLVSIILPTYNEARHIGTALRSLLAQKSDEVELEVLVIDGGSSDETNDRVAEFLSDSRVKHLSNPARSAPAAFNIGLRAARGEYVCILGAHATYAHDYIETCYREMLLHNAAGCSGRVMTAPANSTVSGKLAAWCLGATFASSPNSVRTQRGGFVDTIPYPLFRKSALLSLGGYNEQLVRNQDNDMNHRLRAAGYELYLTAKTHATYFARGDMKSLLEYGYRTGVWNAITLRINAACMRLRHFAPLALVITLAVTALAGLVAGLVNYPSSIFLLLLLLAVGSHLLLGLIVGVQVSIRERNWAGLLLPLVILGFHLAYGIGSLAGLFSSRNVLPAQSTRIPLFSPKSPS